LTRQKKYDILISGDKGNRQGRIWRSTAKKKRERIEIVPAFYFFIYYFFLTDLCKYAIMPDKIKYNIY